MSAVDTAAIPQEIQDLATSLGVDIPTLLAQNPELAAAVTAAAAPAAGAPAAGIGVAAPAAAAAAVPVAIPQPPAAAAAAVEPTAPEPPRNPPAVDPATGLAVPAPAPVLGDGVTAVSAETPLQTMERLLAVQTQENAQLRTSMQTLQAGRVVGSSGLSGPVVDTPPNLGGVEPGLRWAVRNGFVKVEDIADKLIQDLFKNDLGGVI